MSPRRSHEHLLPVEQRRRRHVTHPVRPRRSCIVPLQQVMPRGAPVSGAAVTPLVVTVVVFVLGLTTMIFVVAPWMTV